MIEIVGIGGTTRPGSSTELALKTALEAARANGTRVLMFDGVFLGALPHYGTCDARTNAAARAFVDAIRGCDGLIISSPGYHGTVSGLVKNAIDYIEETARDSRVYLDGLPVGLIATAYGWQATGGTMTTWRAIVHSLRGWPTPYGATVKTSAGLFKDGVCVDATVQEQLEVVGRQVARYAKLHRDDPESTRSASTAAEVASAK